MDSMLSNVQKGSEASLPVQIIIKYHTNIIFETTESNVSTDLNADGMYSFCCAKMMLSLELVMCCHCCHSFTAISLLFY